MSWFRREKKEPEMSGWRIQHRYNAALNKSVYRVLLPGHLGKVGRLPMWEDFDNYDDALLFYFDKTGWSVETEEQP
jgi:hypothetical protein